MAKPTALTVCRYDTFVMAVADKSLNTGSLKSLFSKAEGFVRYRQKLRGIIDRIYLDNSKA